MKLTPSIQTVVLFGIPVFTLSAVFVDVTTLSFPPCSYRPDVSVYFCFETKKTCGKVEYGRDPVGRC